MTTERTLVTKAPTQRPKRDPMGRRNRLVMEDQDPNYVYRVVAVDTDRLNRVQEMQKMGYEVAPGTELSDNRADIGKNIGKTGVVSLGQGTTGVLMRIPKEWYTEYEKEKQAVVDQRVASVKTKLEI